MLSYLASPRCYLICLSTLCNIVFAKAKRDTAQLTPARNDTSVTAGLENVR